MMKLPSAMALISSAYPGMLVAKNQGNGTCEIDAVQIYSITAQVGR